jgi:hypothetical protein
LLPVRWETDAVPELGNRPQEILNQQFVDSCDCLVGIFWTRIGSPTGVAPSGTVEEIERLRGKGKKVLLYFSRRQAKIDDIEPGQLTQLREYRASLQKSGYYETFSDLVDFRDKLSRQIDVTVRRMLEEESSQQLPTNDRSPKLDFRFANVVSGVAEGTVVSAQTTLMTFADFSAVPDYAGDGKETIASGSGDWFTRQQRYAAPLFGQPSKDYYRELLRYLQRRVGVVPIRFSLRNAGILGIKDIYVELLVTTRSQQPAVCFAPSEMQEPVAEWWRLYDLSASIRGDCDSTGRRGECLAGVI